MHGRSRLCSAREVVLPVDGLVVLDQAPGAEPLRLVSGPCHGGCPELCGWWDGRDAARGTTLPTSWGNNLHEAGKVEIGRGTL